MGNKLYFRRLFIYHDPIEHLFIAILFQYSSGYIVVKRRGYDHSILVGSENYIISYFSYFCNWVGEKIAFPRKSFVIRSLKIMFSSIYVNKSTKSEGLLIALFVNNTHSYLNMPKMTPHKALVNIHKNKWLLCNIITSCNLIRAT